MQSTSPERVEWRELLQGCEMSDEVKLSIIGAGLMGKEHLKLYRGTSRCPNRTEHDADK